MSQFDQQRQRLADILESAGVPAVKTETLERYLEHLKQNGLTIAKLSPGVTYHKLDRKGLF